MRRTVCYMLCLFVMAAIISGCSANANAKQATTEDIVANFQKDTASVVKKFSTVVFTLDGGKSIDQDLDAEIKAYEKKYYENPNLTEKESTISNAFLSAVQKYNKYLERKKDKFNVETAVGDYSYVVTTLGTLDKLGFEVNASMK